MRLYSSFITGLLGCKDSCWLWSCTTTAEKWVKLTNNEQHVKWLRMLLGVYLVGLTVLFVVGTTKIVEESDSLGCQCNTLL
jgi:threonine/homoserine/homoserine lactone efflux protein